MAKVCNATTQPVKYDYLTVRCPNNEVIFKITNDGSLYYKEKDSTELKKVECDVELTMLFLSVIGNLTGGNFGSKEELYQTISKNYRSGNIDKIFQK